MEFPEKTDGARIHTGNDGTLFCLTGAPCRQITEVPEYTFGDIRPGDRVLDIGANVGAFCIRAARYSRNVTAVEPVTFEILEENARINNAGIRVIRGALGTGGSADIVWDDCRSSVPSYPLGALIRMAGGCDFLKCDCEGAEWQIRPRDLGGIRRIEMELHLPPICSMPDMALLDYIGDNYSFTIDRSPVYTSLGVMGVLHAVEK